MQKGFWFLALIFLVAGFAACSVSDQSQPQEMTEKKRTLRVVTSIQPLYSLTANLVQGADVELQNLIPAGASEHDFQLKPEDLRALNTADLLVLNGLELEHALEDFLAELSAKVVDSSEGVEALPFSEEGNLALISAAEKEDDHDGLDPHIWLSPLNAGKQAVNIARALNEADPDSAGLYEKNLQDLLARLALLDGEIRGRIGRLQISPYLVLHDAYGYFNRRYGLKPTGVIREFPEKEPSAQELRHLTDLIRVKGITVAFTEPQFNSSVLAALVAEYGLRTAELDPVGADLSSEGYFNLLRRNLAALEAVFSVRAGD